LRQAFLQQKGQIMILRRRLLAATAAIAGSSLAPDAFSQTYPTRPVHIVVPYAAGGTTDAFLRILSPLLEQRWGQPVLLENKPGGGTVIGTAFAAKSPADGYTLVVLANSLVINAKLHKNLPYDALGAFASIAVILDSPLVLAVNATSQITSLSDFLTAARGRPSVLSFATVGPATTQHIACEMLMRATNIKLNYIPYTSGALAVNALLGGHVDSVLANYAEVSAHIDAGKLRPLAVASAKRIEVLKQVPTISESGYPGFEAQVWFGIAAPAGTPSELVAKLADDFNVALNDPATKQRLLKAGLVPAFKGPAGMTSYIAQKYEQFSHIIEDAGIKLE
jgi:tripartite-type tricarboxylate transporter receptor subunit TctC